VVNQLARLGFGFVEVGTVTYEPQPGNPKPRLFRLPEDLALINRLGFNNDGAQTIANRLTQFQRSCIVGVNIGKNKDVSNEEAAENYLKCFELMHPVADYLVINVSSPNTASLRELQEAGRLDELVTVLQKKNHDLGPKPLLIKIAPDLSAGEIEAIVDICLRNSVSGVVATNTTVSRESLSSGNTISVEAGGLSGRPLQHRSNKVISSVYRLSGGKLPIIGVGGVFTAEDAFKKIAAGASLIQAYTGFVYGGPFFAERINMGLATILRKRGYKTLNEAVGSGETFVRKS